MLFAEMGWPDALFYSVLVICLFGGPLIIQLRGKGGD